MEHKLEPVAEPIVDDAKFDKGKSFAYSARVEIRSHVEPKDYFDVPLTKRAPKVTDEQVEQAIKQKQQRAHRVQGDRKSRARRAQRVRRRGLAREGHD